MSNQEYIKIEGAYENNLKHISLDIPKKQITIFTGVSGSECLRWYWIPSPPVHAGS